jgi:hypothetical protein
VLHSFDELLGSIVVYFSSRGCVARISIMRAAEAARPRCDQFRAMKNLTSSEVQTQIETGDVPTKVQDDYLKTSPRGSCRGLASFFS